MTSLLGGMGWDYCFRCSVRKDLAEMLIKSGKEHVLQGSFFWAELTCYERNAVSITAPFPGHPGPT